MLDAGPGGKVRWAQAPWRIQGFRGGRRGAKNKSHYSRSAQEAALPKSRVLRHEEINKDLRRKM